MSPQEFTGIRAKLERLERRQRLTVVGWALTIVSLVIVVSVRQASPASQVLETRGIKIVDPQGRQAILLGLSEANLPGIWVYRPGEKEWAIHLGVLGGGPTIALQEARSGLDLGFGDSLPGLWYRDNTGTRRVAVDFVAGNPEIVLYDRAKKVVWKTP